jgi:hypothetical protein
MKATIIGSDYLQKDDNVKFLEINTNTTIYNDGADLLDYNALFDVLNSNNITEFHYIWTEGVAYSPVSQTHRFRQILQIKCAENNISYTDHIVPMNSVTVPFIEDSNNKFILRQAFDTTALIDETYCADKFEFFNLMKDSQHIPKTHCISDTLNVNSLDDVDYSDTTNPNVLIKYRYPQYDKMQYPALYAVSNNTELVDTINSAENNFLVQEFIFSEDNLVDGKYSIIRGIDIIYGSNLDIINMGGYTQSAVIPVSFAATEFVSGTKKLNQKSRYKYITKEVGKGSGHDYHTDDESNILNYDGTLTNVSTIQLGDYVRSINFVDSNENEAASFTSEIDTYGWDSTLQQSNDTLSTLQSGLVGMISSSVEMVMIKITLEDGRTWSDAPSCVYYIEEKDSTATRFEKVNSLYVGDKLVITDSNTNELTTVLISGLEMIYETKTIYTLDFAPSDLFLVDIGDGDFSVMHNGCWCSWSFCGNSCYQWYCPTCAWGGGGQQKFIP